MDFFFAKRKKQINTIHHKNVTKEDLEAKFHSLDNQILHCETEMRHCKEKIQHFNNVTTKLESESKNTSSLLILLSNLVEKLDIRLGHVENRQRDSSQYTNATIERVNHLEEKVLQLESKNNPKPKLSIEKIPPISFLSK